MLELKKVTDLPLEGKKVLVRADLDVNPDDKNSLYRLEAMIPTLEYLAQKNCEIVLIGHRGRPDGKVDDKLSSKPVSGVLEDILKEKWGEKKVGGLNMHMLENLRFDSREEENSEEYAKELANGFDFFVNEAFSDSHRKHASIVSIPKFLPSAFGMRFALEVETLSKVLEEPKKPVLFLLGGKKEDKLKYLPQLGNISDMTLVAGRLPEYLDDYSEYRVDVRFMVGSLIADKEDLTIHSIEKFNEEVAKAKTIVVAGPCGKFEEEGHRMGTKRVFEAVVENSGAFKVIGGGDTIDAVDLLGLKDKFDWVSVGGGAMLEFLTKKSLPGIEAVKK